MLTPAVGLGAVDHARGQLSNHRRARRHTELGEDAAQMTGHCPCADVEFVGDSLVRTASTHHDRDLALARAQPRTADVRRAARDDASITAETELGRSCVRSRLRIYQRN